MSQTLEASRTGPATSRRAGDWARPPTRETEQIRQASTVWRRKYGWTTH